MCLALPVEVVKIQDEMTAVVEIGGARKAISLALLDGVTEGDYVLVHTGFAIERINEEEARKTLELFEEIANLDEVY